MYQKYDSKTQGLSLNAKRVLTILGDYPATETMTMAKLINLADEYEIEEEDVQFILNTLTRRGLIDVTDDSIDLHTF
jgi:DNA-binding MarR family transcriptional regulator